MNLIIRAPLAGLAFILILPFAGPLYLAWTLIRRPTGVPA